MLRAVSHLRVLVPLPALAAVAAIVMGISLIAGYTRASLASDPHASVRIPAGHDVFAPFILAVAPNTTVTWANDDFSPHAIVTTPQRSAFLNPVPFALRVAPGANATYTFTTSGLYDYYDTGAATWNRDDAHVAANPGVPDFPLSMEGVIWVQGAIAGLPASASDVIPGRDLFATDFLAIGSKGSVLFHDADTDRHVVVAVPGWSDGINPAPVTPLVLAGTDDDPPDGQSSSMTFPRPGLYYLYCSLHASIQPIWHRAQALPSASERPIPMEAFVLVAPQ